MSGDRQFKARFLLGQRLLRLSDKINPRDRKAHVCGGEVANKSEKELWELEERTSLVERALSAEPLKRVALVCDAGLGKTTNMEWLHASLARPGSRQLPLLLRLDTPHLEELLVKEHIQPDTLLNHLASQIGGSDAALQRLLDSLGRYRQQGRITLLIDGLDHAISRGGVPEILSKLLKSAWRNCPVWIAGRPWAFKPVWPVVSGPEWTFLRVEPLQLPEIRFYLSRTVEPDKTQRTGLPWHEFLPEEGRHLLAIPRFLTLIARGLHRAVSEAKLQGQDLRKAVEDLKLRTQADVYRMAYLEAGDYVAPNPKDRTSAYDERLDCRGLIAQGLDAWLSFPYGSMQYLGLQPNDIPDQSNYQRRINFVAALLGAIAFEMYADPVTPRSGVVEGDAAEPPLAPNTVGVPGARMYAFQIAVANRLRQAKQWNGPSIANEFSLLGMANNKTVDFLFFHELGETGLAWHDRTVQAFFAAYWAMNFATPEDFRVMERWKIVFIPSLSSSGEFDEFWQFAAELPKADRKRWLTMFQPCYQPPQELRGQWHRRMIYHSYESMKTRSLKTVTDWRSSYLALENGTPEQQRIYWEIEEGLLLIPEGKCQYGAYPFENPPNPGIEKEVSAFKLHQWPVTNEMYELFDPGHFAERWGCKHPLAGKHGDDRCPVVNVTWYDAWAFAAWCGCCLPTELQWEHAARAGTDSTWFFGNKEEELREYAHYDEDFGTGSTRPVDERRGMGRARQPNPYGLYDIYGNVWEWCNPAVGPGRVYRGGSWNFTARDCRSANRIANPPVIRSVLLGFRVARVPSGSGRVQSSGIGGR